MREPPLVLVTFCSASLQHHWVWKHATGLEESCRLHLSAFDFLSATKCLIDNYHLNISTHKHAVICKWGTSWQSGLSLTNSGEINSAALLGWFITIYCECVFQCPQGNPICRPIYMNFSVNMKTCRYVREVLSVVCRETDVLEIKPPFNLDYWSH